MTLDGKESKEEESVGKCYTRYEANVELKPNGGELTDEMLTNVYKALTTFQVILENFCDIEVGIMGMALIPERKRNIELDCSAPSKKKGVNK